MKSNVAILDNNDFAYIAEVHKLTTPVGAYSFAISSVWRGAKSPTDEQTALQITLDIGGLIALRNLIDAMVQS